MVFSWRSQPVPIFVLLNYNSWDWLSRLQRQRDGFSGHLEKRELSEVATLSNQIR